MISNSKMIIRYYPYRAKFGSLLLLQARTKALTIFAVILADNTKLA